MKLLILGGTIFVGRHIAAEAIARGHEVTLFHRGRHNVDIFPQTERILGDRDGDLQLLHGRAWDAVIDTCGYLPRLVRAAVEQLDAARRYVFISSASVYPDMFHPHLDEHASIATTDNPLSEDVTNETYGPFKGKCEHLVRRRFGERATIARPGLIVGPHDPTDRFAYWPMRMARGGPVIAPGRQTAQLQFIDARDLAAWTITAVERELGGIYNIIGPAKPLTMLDFLHACQAATHSMSQLVWMTDEFLVEQACQPWVDLPLWVPGRDSTIRNAKAVQAHLTFHTLQDTIAETLRWRQSGKDSELKAGLSAVREEHLLKLWYKHFR